MSLGRARRLYSSRRRRAEALSRWSRPAIWRTRSFSHGAGHKIDLDEFDIDLVIGTEHDDRARGRRARMHVQFHGNLPVFGSDIGRSYVALIFFASEWRLSRFQSRLRFTSGRMGASPGRSAPGGEADEITAKQTMPLEGRPVVRAMGSGAASAHGPAEAEHRGRADREPLRPAALWPGFVPIVHITHNVRCGSSRATWTPVPSWSRQRIGALTAGQSDVEDAGAATSSRQCPLRAR